VDPVVLTKFDQALLGEVWVALNLIANRLDPGRLQQSLEFWSRKIGETYLRVTHDTLCPPWRIKGSPMNLVFPISTSLSMAFHVTSKLRESSKSMTG
jgi:hypothetical protein